MLQDFRKLTNSKMSALLFKLSLVGILVLFGAFNVLAQTAGGATVRGIVKDPKGAVIAGAAVTLTNEGTKDERKSTTNGDGIYVFSSVTPGAYTLKIESANFKSSETPHINIAPGDTRGFDFALEIGQSTEVIQVTGTETLQTETGAKENTITAKQIDNLSIISRSALELLRILPGVVAPDGTQLESISFGGGANANNAYHVNGLRGENINVTVDGSRMMDIGSNNGTIITANPDMVSEVKVQTSNYAAEHGSSSINIAASIKSGGSSYHGEVYNYMRPSGLGANDRSNSINGIAKPNSKYDYPGGNFGGPIKLPGGKLKDKLFFFVGYEYYYQRVDEGSSLGIVPTLKQRAGDFSEFLGQSHQILNQPSGKDQSGNELGRILVPGGCTAGGLVPGTPAPNNNIAPCLDPYGKALLNLYPAPNLVDPTGQHNYVYSVLRPNDRNQLVGRIDYNATEKTKLFVRMAREYEKQGFPRGLWWDSSNYEIPGNLSSDNTGRSIAANMTTIINPTMTNEILLSASKLQLNYTYQDPSKVSLKDLGLSYTGFTNPSNGQPFTNNPFVPVSIVDGWGGQLGGNLFSAYGFPILAWNDSYAATDNLSKIKGAHTLKFGGFFEQANKRQQSNHDTDIVLAQWGQAGGAGGTGFDMGDLGVGRPLQFTQSTDRPLDNFRYYNYEGYAQDSWKVRSNLTVEYGVRMSYLPNNFERKGLGVLFDPTKYDQSQGLFIGGDLSKPNGILTAASGQIPKGVLPNNPPQFGPRLGFAWDIGGKGDLVIRGGAGLFYNRVQGNYDYYSSGQPPNVYGSTVQTPWGGPGGSSLTFNDLKNINPFSSIANIGIASRNPYSNQIPRVANMSLTVEKKLPWGNVATIGYVGTQGRHLPQQSQFDYVPLGALSTGFAGTGADAIDLSIPVNRAALDSSLYKTKAPFSAYSSIGYYQFTGTSTYHSLQATLSRQIGKSFQYFATYTFSKALGTTAVNETDGSAWIDPIDPRGRSWGVLPFDRTHVFNISYNYYFPNFAKGAFDNKVGRQALNGWQLSGITTYQSGFPIRLRFIGDLGSNSNAVAWFGTNAYIAQGQNTGAITPIYTSDPRMSGSNLGDKVLNIGSFAIPAFQQSGPFQPPFYIRSPNRSNFDVSLFKDFRISEKKTLQFRAGFFNLFNQAYPTQFDVTNPANSDINLTLDTVSTQLQNLRNANKDPNISVSSITCPAHANGIGGMSNACDPTLGFQFTSGLPGQNSNTLADFGKIRMKRGHRISEIAIKFYF